MSSVRRLSVCLVGLCVAGLAFAGEKRLRGTGSARMIDVQASYTSEWEPSTSSSDASGEFVLTVQAGSRKQVIKGTISPQDAEGKFTVSGYSRSGSLYEAGSGQCVRSDYGYGNRYLLRYAYTGGHAEALVIEKPIICSMDFTLKGGSRFQLHKVYDGDLILIDGSGTNTWGDKTEFIDFEVLDATVTTTECDTDSGVYDCYGGGGR